MSISPGLVAFKLAFQVSPIILTGGVAELIPGGMLPIIAITEAINFATGLLSQGTTPDLDSFFAVYEPMAGATLVDNDFGKYPFANQAVAANAVIANPLVISLMMHCPVRDSFGYASKLATMMALQATLAKHNASGGTYTIATPSFFYTNCLMAGMRDASKGESKQRQSSWQLDFVKPLLTLEQAAQAQNSLMSKITGGVALPSVGGALAWSGLAPTLGTPTSLAGTSIVPSTAGAPGASVAGFAP